MEGFQGRPHLFKEAGFLSMGNLQPAHTVGAVPGRSGVQFGPVVYEHAAAFIGKSPYAVSRSAELLAQAHGAAFEFYAHRPITAGIDVYNLEAEAYGSVVPDPAGPAASAQGEAAAAGSAPANMDVPSIKAPIVQAAQDILKLPDWDVETGSRFGLGLRAADMLRQQYPGADIRIPLGGPFSIASNLLGFDNLLCEAMTDPEAVGRALIFLAEKQVQVTRTIARRGFGISFFESAAAPPLLSPDLFRKIEMPALERFCLGARACLGTTPALIIGGDTYPVLADILSLDPGFLICPGETDQRSFMEALRTRPDIGVRINMRVSVLMNGTGAEARQEVDRVLRIALDTAVPGRPLLLGTGVLPVDADPEKIRRIGAYLRSAGSA
jgi:hypothetical protein